MLRMKVFGCLIRSPGLNFVGALKVQRVSDCVHGKPVPSLFQVYCSFVDTTGSLLQDMKFNRQNLLERDDFRCQYCGKVFAPKELNMDHVLPRDRGGGTSWENVVTSCIRCKVEKATAYPMKQV